MVRFHMKLSVIEPERVEEIVQRISRFAKVLGEDRETEISPRN